MAKFSLGEEVVCLDDSPGIISKMTTIKKMKKYRVIAVCGPVIMVNDGTNGFWHERRFRKPGMSFGEKITRDILSKAKIEELLTTKLSAQ